ncbi:amidohydrolase [Glaciecola siphonariae]|uniref:Amidohydrolase n=1 Tax=Glaciecola siphonariae TaxID=521012 RepID=A0ABV9M0R0_9ALTE
MNIMKNSGVTIKHSFLASMCALVVLMAGCSERHAETSKDSKAPIADRVLMNANVLSLDANNTQAQALAISNGKILFIGSNDDVRNFIGANSEVEDLDGRTVLPGFIDAHGHFLQTGMMALAANLLPPPDNDVSSVEQIIDKLKAKADSDMTKELGWIIGMGYDDAQLEEGRHPTRTDLDKVSTDVPVLAVHQSSHLGAVNSKALEVLGISNDVTDPEGGKFRRNANGELSGVVEELAFFGIANQAFAKVNSELVQQAIAASQKAYFAAGFTTAQEGRAQLSDVQAVMGAAKAGALDIDVGVFPDPTLINDDSVFIDDIMALHSPNYANHARIAGIKLSLDGSPQVKTAWLSKPYHKPLEGQSEDYAGYPQLDTEVINKYIQLSYENDWQVLAHVNGDAAIDQFLDAIEQAHEMFPDSSMKPVAIHAQTAREDQLDRMARVNMIPSFMSVHAFYWGDWHRDSVLGENRAAHISPAKSALTKGLTITSHNDAPVTLPNSQMILYSMVNRLTRSEQVLGADERVDIEQAIRAITSSAAYQLSEDATKGSIEAGKYADLVIVDKNPLEMPSTELLDHKVLSTIKEGKTVYSAPN